MNNSRRGFFKKIMAGSAMFAGIPIIKVQDLFEKTLSDCNLAVVTASDPATATIKAIEALGGIKRFISQGDKVVIKPNIGWNRSPEQAADTNPIVVATVVNLCFEAGAASVIVTDRSCHPAPGCFDKSGIMEAALKAGAKVILPTSALFAKMNMKGAYLKEAPVYKPLVEADKLINIPIAKHHALTTLTLGMKNWLGGMGGSRGSYHKGIHHNLADMAAFFRPQLTIIDAFKVLLRNGPIGGNLSDVALKQTIIASADPIAADAYATGLFGLKPSDIPCIMYGEKLGLGTSDLSNIKIEKINLL